MKKTFIFAATLLGASIASAQGYVFTDEVIVPVSSVKNQASSGTCWCFATCSFLESELMRMGKGEHDLSEMFIVRQKLLNQLNDNYLRRGKGNIGQGSLSHTFLNAYRQVGIVPESAYSGINYDSDRHNHGEMMSMLTAVADAGVKNRKRSPQYDAVVNSILDAYLGPLPEKFTYNGKEYTPISFAQSLGFNPDDYVELTSFTHHPYYKAFELEVPDNWEHAKQYNLPLDELMQVMDYALDNGHTVCWDGDVSENGFSFTHGVAINPEVKDLSRYAKADSAEFAGKKETERLQQIYKFEKPYPEVAVTPEIRQEGFESFVTTDDHLMHITGRVADSNGTKYYRTKNSWGTDRNDFGGYLNMSDSYVRAKTIYIMVHKDAIPANIRKKLKI
jgi:bleomycin hydrolase